MAKGNETNECGHKRATHLPVVQAELTLELQLFCFFADTALELAGAQTRLWYRHGARVSDNGWVCNIRCAGAEQG